MLDPSELIRPLARTATLEDCAQEPIHLPERIQSAGALLVVEAASLTITRVSENCADVLGQPPEALLEQPLSVLLNTSQVDIVRARQQGPLAERLPLRLFVTQFGGRTVACLGHRRDDRMLLEFEPAPAEPEGGDYDLTFKRLSAILEQESAPEEFAQHAVLVMREMIGYDRVMFYRFAADGSGEVLAESRREDLPTYLGLHYPASDIPEQARRLYLANPVRVIVDVQDDGCVLLRHRSRAEAPLLDLGYAHLRTVSPIHREYLRHMGVRATLTISIVHQGRLEALIACHHYQPRRVSHHLRTLCEHFGRIIGYRFFNLVEVQESRELAPLTEHKAALVHTLMNSPETRRVDRLLEAHREPVLGLMRADAAAFRVGDTIHCIGRELSDDWLEQLFAAAPEGIVSSHLADDLPQLPASEGGMVGALLVPISSRPGDAVAWFRLEERRTVTWAGYPQEKEEATSGARLSPRKSFEKWVEERRGHAASWTPREVEVAGIFVRLNWALVLENFERRQAEEQYRRTLEELARSNEDLNNFAYAASHDLQEPLRAISGCLRVLERRHLQQLDERARVLMQHAIDGSDRMRRMINGLLEYSRVSTRGQDRSEIDLNEVLASALQNLSALVEEAGAQVRSQRLPKVSADFHQCVALFQNIIGNSVKYRREAPPEIEIGVLERGTELEITFSDNGIGIEPRFREQIFGLFERLHTRDQYAGFGIGLALCGKIVERHGGRIWADDSRLGGTAIVFTLPVIGEGEEEA